MDVIILLLLIAAIIIGFTFKVNTGIVATAIAFLLVIILDHNESLFIKGFPTKLIMQLVGITLVFSMACENGTLDLTARKFIALFARRAQLIPFVIFLISAILAAVGPGGTSVISFLTIFAIALSREKGVNPLLNALMVNIGASAGTLSPIATTAMVANETYIAAGMAAEPMRLFFHSMLVKSLFAVVLYFILKGYKISDDALAKEKEVIPKYSKNQLITLFGLLAMVVLTLITGYSAGFIAFIIAVILSIFKVSNEKKAIAMIPWSTLIMIAGISIMINLVVEFGGMDTLAGLLTSFMSPRSAAWVMGFIAGIMSLFSSTTGTVLPTLVPLIPDIITQLGVNIDGITMLSSIVNTAHMAGISPLSTGGALTLSAYSMSYGGSEKDQRRMFVRLFGISIFGIAFMVVMSMVGIYKI